MSVMSGLLDMEHNIASRTCTWHVVIAAAAATSVATAAATAVAAGAVAVAVVLVLVVVVVVLVVEHDIPSSPATGTEAAARHSVLEDSPLPGYLAD